MSAKTLRGGGSGDVADVPSNVLMAVDEIEKRLGARVADTRASAALPAVVAFGKNEQPRPALRRPVDRIKDNGVDRITEVVKRQQRLLEVSPAVTH